MYVNFEAIEKAYYGYWYTENPNRGKAIRLAEEAYDKFPSHHNQIIMDLIVFYGSIKNIKKCKEYLKLGFDKHLWYPEIYVREFWHSDEYQEERKIWDAFSEEAKRLSKVETRVELPFEYDQEQSYPLFVSLHGFGEDLTMFKQFWSSQKLKEDFIHVFIQSSIQIGSHHYKWGEKSKAYKDIANVINQIKDQYKIRDTFIGGFSEGSTVAMEYALANSDVVKGFISLNPDKPRNYTESLMSDSLKNSLRGVIITGDQDRSYKAQCELVDLFNDKNLPCLFEVKKDFGHWFPDDLSEKIDMGITFIKGEKNEL